MLQSPSPHCNRMAASCSFCEYAFAGSRAVKCEFHYPARRAGSHRFHVVCNGVCNGEAIPQAFWHRVPWPTPPRQARA